MGEPALRKVNFEALTPGPLCLCGYCDTVCSGADMSADLTLYSGLRLQRPPGCRSLQAAAASAINRLHAMAQAN